MPLRLNTPLLTVDAKKMHQIDTSNVENLFSMWSVFNRCAESMEEGRRLENLSWRLWNRETFCCDSKPRFPDTPTSRQTTPKPYPSKKHTPELSASVDSIATTEEDEEEEVDDEDHHSASRLSPSIRIQRLTSNMSSSESFSSTNRSRCKPISPDELERMVVSIKDTKLPRKFDLANLSTSLTEALPTVSLHLESPPAPPPPPPVLRSPPVMTQQQVIEKEVQSSSSPPFSSTAPGTSPASVMDRSQVLASDDMSVNSFQSRSIVRGFGPNKISSHRSSASLASAKSPVPTKSVLRKTTANANANGNFMLGGSSDDESSFDESRSLRPSGSSLAIGLKQHPQQHTPKMTTFQEEVEIHRDQIDDEGAIDSDDSDAESDISESAIEEEEDAWEDDDQEDTSSDKDQLVMFQRVPSKPNLVSRRSLLTTGLHESERATALTAQASKSHHSLPQLSRQQQQPKLGRSGLHQITTEAPPSQPSVASGIARSKAMAVPATATQQVHCALSPRTTRRNMLSTELTESLRQNLLWERQFKNTTAQAFLKRRHTAHENLGKLQHQHTQPTITTDSSSPSRKASWDNVFNSSNEYNTRGW